MDECTYENILDASKDSETFLRYIEMEKRESARRKNKVQRIVEEYNAKAEIGEIPDITELSQCV